MCDKTRVKIKYREIPQPSDLLKLASSSQASTRRTASFRKQPTMTFGDKV